MKPLPHIRLCFLAALLIGQLAGAQTVTPDTSWHCQQGSATFTVGAGAQDSAYQWQMSNPGEENWEDIPNSDNTAYTTGNFTPPGKDFRVVVIRFGGEKVTSNTGALAVLNLPPAPDFAGVNGFCPGNSTTISITNATGYAVSWSGPTSLPAAAQVNIDVPGAYTATLSPPALPGCATTGVLNISAFPNPNLSIANGANIEICPNTPLTLTATTNAVGMIQWEWDGPAGLASSQNPWTLQNPAQGNYKVTVTDGNGCMANAQTQVNLLNAPVVNIQPQSPFICNGQAWELQANGGPFASLSWSGPMGFSSTNNPASVPNPFPGVYSVTVSNNAGCTATAAITTDYPPGLNPDLEADFNTICPGQNFDIRISNYLSTNSYQWSTGGGGQAININAPGTYTVTVTGPFGLCSAQGSIDIPEGSVSFDITGSTLFCESDPVALSTTAPQPGGITYTWNWNGTGISNPNQQGISINGLTPNQYFYYVTVTNEQGCSATASRAIQVVAAPDAQLQGPLNPCKNAVHQLYTLSPSDFSVYKWEIEGDGVLESDAAKPYASVHWGNANSAVLKVKISVGSCTADLEFPIDFQAKEALPEGEILLKPSGDLLIFGYTEAQYPDPLRYEWGAYQLDDNGNPIPFALPDKINDVPVLRDRQYYYIGTLSPDVFYYVDIQTAGNSCVTRCFYPSNPFARIGQPDDPNPTVGIPTHPGRILPNPNRGDFKVQLPAMYEGRVQFVLHSSLGAVLANGMVEIEDGMGHFAFTPQSLPRGMYYLELGKPDYGLFTTLKFIVQ